MFKSVEFVKVAKYDPFSLHLKKSMPLKRDIYEFHICCSLLVCVESSKLIKRLVFFLEKYLQTDTFFSKQSSYKLTFKKFNVCHVSDKTNVNEPTYKTVIDQ